jgi:hypothetical protein
MEYLSEHLYKEPKTIEELCPDLVYPESLQRFISKMLEKKRAKRFQTCEEALAFLTGMVIPDFDDMDKNPKAKPKVEGKRSSKGGAGKRASSGATKGEKKGCLGMFFGKKGSKKKPSAK